MSSHAYVLMLEKDDDDVYITSTTVLELGITTPITFVKSFEQLMDHLSAGSKPSLILLSYSSPPVSIESMLEQLKTDAAYYHIPVVVLSEDISPEKVRDCYRMGANSIIKKPSSMELTAAKMETFFRYWFQVAEL